MWLITPALLLAIDDRLGDPDDAYVNGSQVWIVDYPDFTLEWRLHPVAAFPPPAPHDLLAEVVFLLKTDTNTASAPPLPWDGLEAFPAFGDEVEPAPLAAHVTEVLGVGPDAFGIVDHTPIGDAWEHSQGGVSVIEMLLEQLRS